MLPWLQRSLITFFVCLSAELSQAQLQRDVSELLFEPVVLVNGVPTIEYPLVSLAAAQDAAEHSRLSLAQRRELQSQLDNYLSRVGDQEADQGPFAPSLREELFSTAKLYEQLGDADNAIRTFHRALNVSRLNFGLDNLDQIEILEALALNYLQKDLIMLADEMMDAAYQVAVANHGQNTQAMAEAEGKMGDWNTKAFLERSTIVENIPRMNVQRFMQDPRNYIDTRSSDIRSTTVMNLREARINYLNAIKPIAQANNFTHPLLHGLERKLLTNLLLTTHRENILYEPDFYLTRKVEKTASRLDHNGEQLRESEDYPLGLLAHKRRMAYLVGDPNRQAEPVVTAMLEEADWDLLFARQKPGLEKYQAAYQFFTDNPSLLSTTQSLLYPALPVVLPTYLPAPNSRAKLGIAANANVQYFGYIDVSFGLTKFGKARKIKQLGIGGEINSNIEVRLGEYLRRVQFRPRFTGKDIDTSTLTLRYYVGL